VGIPSIVAQIGAGLGGVKVLCTHSRAGRADSPTTLTEFGVTGRPHPRATWNVNK